MLLFEAILNNRIRQIAVPIVPQGLSLKARSLLRIPLGLGLGFVSVALLSLIVNGSPIVSFLSSSPLGLDVLFCIL